MTKNCMYVSHHSTACNGVCTSPCYCSHKPPHIVMYNYVPLRPGHAPEYPTRTMNVPTNIEPVVSASALGTEKPGSKGVHGM